MTIDSTLLPDKIYKFNVYDDADKLIGVGEELTLPDLEPLSSTTSGSGIMGEIDVPLVGMFKSIEVEIPFNSLYSDFKNYARVGHSANLTIRAATNTLNRETFEPVPKGIRIAMRGICKKLSFGKIKSGEATDTKVTMELIYIAVYLDDQEVIVLDKLNDVYRVDGTDAMLDISALL